MRHAVIGAGYGGSAHLPAFSGLPGVDVIAIVDGGSGQAQRFSRPGLLAYSNWQRMLEDLCPDSVSVVVPPAAQREIVTSLVSRGIHVLCDKPFGQSTEDAVEMLRSSEAATVTAALCFQYRFEPGMQALRRQVSSGRLGQLRRIDFCWITAGRADPGRLWSWQHDASLGGGVINAFLPHVLDLISWLSGCAVRSVVAQTAVLVSSRQDNMGINRQVNAEDMVDVLIELGNGIVANIRITNCQWGGEGMRIELYGESGVLSFTHQPPFKGDVELKFGGRDACIEVVDLPRPASVHADTRTAALQQLAQLFIDAVCGNQSPDLPTFRDGERAQRELTAVRSSAASRTFVTL